jgi:hypothetical protein
LHSHPKLAELLRHARRRAIAHALIHLLALSAAIAFAAAALILLVGTQLLSWYWLLAACVASLAVGFAVYRKRFPSEYAIAQKIDARLKLDDALSTAAYFAKVPESGNAAIRELQRNQAERIAEAVDLKQGLPLARPPAFFAAAALAVAVVGILLLRYAVLGSFDPRVSLVANAYGSFFGSPRQHAGQPGGAEQGSQPGGGKESDKNNDFAGDPSPQFEPAAPENQNPEPNQQAANNKDQAADRSQKQDSPPGPDQTDPSNQSKQDRAEQPPNGNQTAKNAPDQSMIDKIREALSDMLNKMKSPPSESSQNQKGQRQSQDEQQKGQQGDTEDRSDSQQAQNGQQSDQAQSEGNNGQNKPSQQQQNGIGSQEGDKAAREAEALKAMGKISELMGKRAENVKGAVMVEVGSTKQQLKTPVAQNSSTHAEAGSELHRDEVPPMYEQFVQKYFEQIRKAERPAVPTNR